jgi:hypothetical protein
MVESRTELATRLMDGFAYRTGLVAGEQHRYLWTDAFAVCNFVALAKATGDAKYDALALLPVDAVHHTLGRHRPDSKHSGWLSGLAESVGEKHPTIAGLRIGKPLPEREHGQPLDPAVEWDRDGQYFHYLTKWVHALLQMSRVHNDSQFLLWAIELADTAHRRFTYGSRTKRRMYWKMSVDLKRPLVTSMGQHDPIDGLVTCVDLDFAAATIRPAEEAPELAEAIADFTAMVNHASIATTDPLGIGGLLMDVWRLAQLIRAKASHADPELLEDLLSAALHGLTLFAAGTDMSASANYRLAFRELGLAIGLAGVASIDRAELSSRARSLCVRVDDFAHLQSDIENFWIDDANRRSKTWLDHADINDVMLATSLLPDGFLSRSVASR